MNKKIKSVLNKKTTKVTFVFISFLTTIFVTFMLLTNLWGKTDKPLSEFLVEVPGMPPLRVIQTENLSNNTQLVKNVVDSYQIVIPKEWGVDDLTSVEAGLNIYFPVIEKSLAEQLLTETHDGLILNIRTLKNEKHFSVIDWVTKTNESKDFLNDSVFKEIEHSSSEALGARDIIINLDGEPAPNSALLRYVLGNKERIYILTCSIVGNDFAELTQKCEDAVKTFKIL